MAVPGAEGEPRSVAARTVADEFGISPANARKIHERHFTRVNAVIWADERYEPLRHWDWFAA